MATGDLALGQEQGALNARQRVVNDFSINVATVNGSGSQSANSVLLKSISEWACPSAAKTSSRRTSPDYPLVHHSRQQRRLRSPHAQYGNPVALNPKPLAKTSSVSPPAPRPFTKRT